MKICLLVVYALIANAVFILCERTQNSRDAFPQRDPSGSLSGAQSEKKKKSRTGSVAVADPILRVQDIVLPKGGFIKTKVGSISLSLRVSKVVNRPPFCQMIGFTPQPKPNPSPFSGEQIFHIILDDRVNDRFVWTNGVEFLSYVKHEDEKLDKDLGTWIIGSEPGQDNGFVYLRVNNTHTLSPIGLEGEGAYWHWLIGKEWKEQREMRVVCVDKYAPTARYYEVEYFDPRTYAAQSTYLVTDFSPYLLVEQETKQAVDLDYEMTLLPDNPVISTLLDIGTHQWLEITGLSTVFSYGEPYAILEQSTQKTTVAVLINDEHASDGGWRMTFRKYHFTTAEREAALLSETDDEFLIDFDSNGVRGTELSVSPLTVEQRALYSKSVYEYISVVQPGEFLWLWLQSPQVNPSAFNYIAHIESELAEKSDELLVKCVARNSSSILFQYYPTDRMQQMRQTILKADTDFFEVDLNSETFSFSAKLKGRNVEVQTVFPIGKKVVKFLRRYIETKEGHPNGMSSCYMYHAAASMPQALLYATEILCVLLGYKPLTLIQYSSPSEHQWKFPLVRELSQAITATKQLLGDAMDLKVRINKYQADESLIIYRNNWEFVNEGLLPKFEAQALHPLPYPDSKNPEPDWKLQIYNAWWNGVILGYPEYFVDSYCETFHNGLDQNERVLQMQAAKQALLSYLKSINQTVPRIGKGNDQPIHEDHLIAITSLAEC